MNDESVILRLEGVYKSFGPTEVLRGVDLEIQTGRTTVVIGPSGCGKSVLLKHMAGLLKPDAGKVFFRRHEVSHLDERHLAPIRRRMGFLFQGAALFDSMTVEENICFPMVEHRVGTDASRKARAAEVLAMVGLDGLQSRFPEELSGGQKKRVALARAIALNPQVIFYDEPTTGLDPIRADLINELILRLREALGNTAVVVTHDLASARKVGDRILMLHGGKFILDTTPEELDHVQDEVVAQFVAGRAGPEELAEIDAGRLARHAQIPETRK
ncbi:MAG: ABC transporter ATP-binding protein [Phycisphaerae bacterium]|nr:ABC transporter ATP-binding protein [Phycisphaerae bacterium]